MKLTNINHLEALAKRMRRAFTEMSDDTSQWMDSANEAFYQIEEAFSENEQLQFSLKILLKNDRWKEEKNSEGYIQELKTEDLDILGYLPVIIHNHYFSSSSTEENQNETISSFNKKPLEIMIGTEKIEQDNEKEEEGEEKREKFLAVLTFFSQELPSVDIESYLLLIKAPQPFPITFLQDNEEKDKEESL